jgi:hypothetical protein
MTRHVVKRKERKTVSAGAPSGRLPDQLQRNTATWQSMLKSALELIAPNLTLDVGVNQRSNTY